MSRVDFHPDARAEFFESTLYYEAQQQGLGIRFRAAVQEGAQKIQSRPQLYPIIEDDVRQCRVQRFPYGVIYRIRGDAIQIIAVMHLHRKPGYWRERLES